MFAFYHGMPFEAYWCVKRVLPMNTRVSDFISTEILPIWVWQSICYSGTGLGFFARFSVYIGSGKVCMWQTWDSTKVSVVSPRVFGWWQEVDFRIEIDAWGVRGYLSRLQAPCVPANMSNGACIHWCLLQLLLWSCCKDSADTLLPQKLSSMLSVLFTHQFHIASCFLALWLQKGKAEKQESYMRLTLLTRNLRLIDLTASVVLLTV